MSKRFGRQQKRKMQQKIADLHKKIVRIDPLKARITHMREELVNAHNGKPEVTARKLEGDYVAVMIQLRPKQLYHEFQLSTESYKKLLDNKAMMDRYLTDIKAKSLNTMIAQFDENATQILDAIYPPNKPNADTSTREQIKIEELEPTENSTQDELAHE